MSIELLDQVMDDLRRGRVACEWAEHWQDAEQIGKTMDALRAFMEAAEKQEPVACSVCKEVHAILDADESQIIRDAKDGYPDGRKPRILTLQERVTALCVYAADWKRWCLEKENITPPAAQRQPLTTEQMFSALRHLFQSDELCHAAIKISLNEYRAIEAACHRRSQP